MARHVRMFCGWSGFPLWDRERSCTVPEDWPMLSPSLLEALTAWELYVSKHVLADLKWTCSKDAFCTAERARLLEQVRSELGDEWEVEG